MPRISTFNFTGAPPDQSGAPDYIPPGRYRFRVHEMVDTTSKSSGKRMVSLALDVAEGDKVGSRVYDYFADLDTPGATGLKRLHACFLALGIRASEKQMKVDLEPQTGKYVVADVKDTRVPATEQYEERTGSRIATYIIPGVASTNGAAPAIAAPAPVAQAAPQPAPAPPQPDPVAAFVPAAAPVEEDELSDVFS